MFCNHCGQEVLANQRFCGGCGNPAHNAPAPPQHPSQPPSQPYASSATGRVARHVKGLAIFWMVLSALNLLKAGGRFFGARVIGHWGHDWFDDGGFGFPVGDILPAVLSTMGLISLLLAGVGFIVGFGLMERRPWARTLAIVVGIIALLHPLLGTILGIYTLWVLLPGDAEAEYRGMSRP